MAKHLIDNRLFVNAGMRFPACKAREELLDLDAARWSLTNEPAEVTCKTCKKIHFIQKNNHHI